MSREAVLGVREGVVLLTPVPRDLILRVAAVGLGRVVPVFTTIPRALYFEFEVFLEGLEGEVGRTEPVMYHALSGVLVSRAGVGGG